MTEQVSPDTAAPVEGTPQDTPQDTPQVAPDKAIVAALAGKREQATAQEAAVKESLKETPKEPEAPKEEVKAPDAPTGGLNDIDLSDLGNPEVQYVVNAFRNEMPEGLDLERVFALAIETGDPALINKSYLRQAGGDNAEYLTSLAERIVTEASTQNERLIETIYNEAGGQENWDAAAAVFNKEAPKHIKLAAQRFIDSKNYKEIEHGLRIVLDYAKKSGGTVQQGTRHNPSAGAATPKALSKEQYKEALQKLGTNPSAPGWQESWNELEKQRRAGMQLGI